MGFSKRGQTAPDTATVLIVLFISGIAFITVYQLLQNVNDDIQADASFNAEAKASLQTVADHYATNWDAIFAMTVVLLWVFLLVTAFFVDTHPIFFIITAILLIALFVTVPIIANAYMDYADETTVYSADFPVMNWVFSHLVIVIIVMAFSAGVVLYAKNQ